MKNNFFNSQQSRLWAELSRKEKWKYVLSILLTFIKKYYLTIIFVVAAIISCLFVPIENQTLKHYIVAFNPKTILCLFALMLTIVSLQNIKFFKKLSALILQKIHNLRTLIVLLVFIPAIFALFITNDVALITFIPFTAVIMEMAGHSNKLPKAIILQTLACNLAGTISPIGTLQNVYLLDTLHLHAFDFIVSSWPIAIAGYGLILIIALIEKNDTILSIENSNVSLPKGKTLLYISLFILCLIAIFDFVKTPRLYWIIVPIVTILILVFDRYAFKRVNYQVLLLFLAMFVIGANFKSIPTISNFLIKIMAFEFFVLVGGSQILNNTTVVAILAPFHQNISHFLLGSAVSKFGSPLSTTANQMVLTMYPSDTTRKVFVKWYLIAEFGFLAFLTIVGILRIYL